MKLKQYLRGGIALTSGLLLSTAASAAVINLNADADMVILQDGNVNGAGQGLFVGQNGQGTNERAMISFDVSSLAGATINSVTLTMHVNAQGYLGSPESIGLHEMTLAWTESTAGGGGPTSGGGGGAVPNVGDAVWGSHAAAHDVTASGTAIAQGGGTIFSFIDGGLITDVQNWVNGGSNFGWMMIGNESAAGSAKRLTSSEGGNAGTTVPVLTIDYTATVVPVPAAVWLFGSGLLGLVGIARRKTRV